MAFFGGGGASVDLASPPAIGNTTPNTGAFTTLSFAPAANATGLSSSSYSLTGSNAQSLVSLSGTWNTTGTPSAILLNITNTASNANSRFFDLQLGGTSHLLFTRSGDLVCGQSQYGGIRIRDSLGGNSTEVIGKTIFFRNDSGNILMAIDRSNTQSFVTISTGYFAFSNSATDASAVNADVRLYRDAASVLAQRTGTTAQECRFYRTFTDASNYERLSLIATRTTRFAIAAENAGTGAARSLEISFYTSASDPTSTDITSGCFSIWKNSGTGTIKLWANDGGTMKSVALA